MTRNHRRLYLFIATLSVLLPLVGFTYCLAQTPALPTGGGVSLNWPSLILTLIGMLMGSGIAWGTFLERVKQHGTWLADHEKQLKGLDNTYMRQDLCREREQATTLAAATAAREVAQVALTAAESVATAHRDMQEIAAGVKRLLEKAGG